MRAGRRFHFDAAHFLPEYEGKCEELHGHTYTLDVVVEGELNKEGMVMDFNKLKGVVKKNVLDKLDHKNLNEIFQNPTAENIASWIFEQLKDKVNLKIVRLYEGKSKWVEIEK